MIQLRRFMLLFVDVDFWASAMDVKLNSCPHCELDNIVDRSEAVLPIVSCSEMILQDSSIAFQPKIVVHCLHTQNCAFVS